MTLVHLQGTATCRAINATLTSGMCRLKVREEGHGARLHGYLAFLAGTQLV